MSVMGRKRTLAETLAAGGRYRHAKNRGPTIPKTLTPPPFSPKQPHDDHAPPLDPHHHLVALDRFSGGAMAWGLMS